MGWLCNNKILQLLNEAEDLKNSAGRGGCHDNTLRDVQNSSYRSIVQ